MRAHWRMLPQGRFQKCPLLLHPDWKTGELCAYNTRHLDASTFSLENAFCCCQNSPSSSSSPKTPVNLEGGKKKKSKNHQDDLPVRSHQMGTRWIHFRQGTFMNWEMGEAVGKEQGGQWKKKIILRCCLDPTAGWDCPVYYKQALLGSSPGVSPGCLVGSNEQSFPHLPPAPAPPSLSPQVVAQMPVQFSSVAQSCPTLRPHGLQHARPRCPSPTPGVYSNSCPSSR